MKFAVKALFLASAALGAIGTAHAAAPIFTARSCQLDEVASFSNRVHLHCAATGAALTDKAAYYAVEANSAMAQSVIQIGLQALAAHKPVDVFYDNSILNNPDGCLKTDCNRLLGVSIK